MFTFLLFLCFLRFNLGLGLAVAALAALVTGDGLVKVFLAEVGPVGIAEVEL